MSSNPSLTAPFATSCGWSPATDYPPFPIPPQVRDGMIQALARGETHYAPVPGVASLRIALAQFLGTLGWQIQADGNLVITNGEQEARFFAIQTLCRDGKTLALPAIVHPGAARAAEVGQIRKVAIPRAADGRLEPTVEVIKETLDQGTRVLYLESPNRLTGRAFDHRELDAIGAAVAAADAQVVWDQSLAPLLQLGKTYASPGSVLTLAGRCLALGTLWPTLGMEEYHLGYLAGGEPLIQPIQTLRQIVGICTTTPAQWAAVAGAGFMSTLLGERLAALTKAWEFGRSLLKQEQIEVLDGDTVAYLTFRLPWVNAGSTARAVDRLVQAGFVVATGEPFGAPNVVRLTITSRLLEPRTCA